MGLSDQMPLGRRGLSKLVNLRAARKTLSDARTATYVIFSTGSGPGGRRLKSNRQVQAIPRSRIGLHSNCEVHCNTWNLSNLSNRLSNDLTNGQGIRLFKVNDHQAALARASCCSLPLECLQHALALHLCQVGDSRRSREQTAYNWICLEL